ncbi:hypothetical protein G6F56_005961 [Rhizopus delemar]|uniref:Uncharacterized protein n=1 Tax=Rhizopus stolonifer TaxID=4846 RepID=A0A367JU30_RHIST|nr:hypothetical protein G6F56_005961 [Rhizopus delemar]RCH93437.1 hypothetical protein CU098_009588 [Rhizopus stolonifer]
MPFRTMTCTAALASVSNKYPRDRSTNTFLNAAPILMKAAKASAQPTSLIKTEDINTAYYSFCPKCGVDILIFSHESFCPLS